MNLHLATEGCTPATAGDCRWLDLQDLAVARGRMEAEVLPGVSSRIEGVVRLHPVTAVEEVGDAAYGERVQRLTIELPVAEVLLEEVLFPALDLRLGQQRVAWGTAYGVNPVDVVNPYDLRDPMRFDARLGIPAARALLHGGKVALDIVYVPLFRPARMPVEVDLLEDADALFDFSDVGGADLDIGELETRTTVPDGRVGFASVAARASIATRHLDAALVAYRGRDSLPQVGGEAVLVGFAADTDRVDVGIPVLYPSLTLLGLEFRAPLFWDIGGWVEGAVVFPDRIAVTASRAQLESLVSLGVLDAVPDPLPETVLQDGRPFPRWVVGLDRFIGRFSLVLQWIHGLPTERTAADLSDYGALAVVVTLSDPVQFRLQGLSDARGWLIGGHLAILHRDSAEIMLGADVAGGPEGSALGQLSDLSRVSAGVEVAF